MNEHLFNVIRKTIKEVNKGTVLYSLIGTRENHLTPEPWFYKKGKSQLDSYQIKNMGFYVIRNTFRGILMSINFLAAGDFSLKKKYLAPSIINYYTAAYHLFNGFLALRGRLIFENIVIYDGKKFIEDKRYAIVNFSNGKWCVNTKNRSHMSRWNELIDLRLTEYPNSFKKLFEYWYKHRIKEDITPTEYILKVIKGEKLGTPIEINDIVKEFLHRIAETRHHSVYQSFGSEPEVFTHIVNNDTSSYSGIDFQARVFKEFSYQLLSENVSELIYLLNKLRVNKKTRNYLWISIFQPWFDSQKIEDLDDKRLSQKIEQLKKWIFATRQFKIK